MTTMKIIAGGLALVFVAIGIWVVSVSMTHAAKKEKSKLLLIGLAVFISGVVLGYVTVQIFLNIEGQSH
jgi:glucose uptake protein GlcU